MLWLLGRQRDARIESGGDFYGGASSRDGACVRLELAHGQPGLMLQLWIFFVAFCFGALDKHGACMRLQLPQRQPDEAPVVLQLSCGATQGGRVARHWQPIGRLASAEYLEASLEKRPCKK